MDLGLLISIVLIGVGVYFWKTYSHPRYFWALFPLGLFVLIELYESISNTYLYLSDDGRAIEFFVTTGLRVVIVVIFGYILFKDPKQK